MCGSPLYLAAVKKYATNYTPRPGKIKTERKRKFVKFL